MSGKPVGVVGRVVDEVVRAFSPDGRLVATTHPGGLRVLRTSDGIPVYENPHDEEGCGGMGIRAAGEV